MKTFQETKFSINQINQIKHEKGWMVYFDLSKQNKELPSPRIVPGAYVSYVQIWVTMQAPS